MLQRILDRFNRSSPCTQKALLVKFRRLQHKKRRNDCLGKVDIQLECDISETASEFYRLQEMEATEAAEIAGIVAELERESIL